MGEIQELKLILREETSPFFTDEEIAYYLNKNKKIEYFCFAKSLYIIEG